MDDLLDTAPCGFLAFADDGTIALINSTLLRMLGYSSTELEGRRVEALLPAASRIFFRTYFFPRLQLHGSLEEVYLLLRDRDGADLPVLINAVRRERAGSVLNDCVIVSMRQRGLLEDELLKARKIAEEASHTAALARAEAERANTAKSAFLASMSHELRTPLNAIIGYAELLQETGHEEAHAERLRDLQRIEGASKHLLGLIDEVLDFSKIEAGRMTMSPEVIDVCALVSNVVATARGLIEKNGNRLVVDCAGAGTMVADAVKTRQILLNLLSNAGKFTSNGDVHVAVTRHASPAPGYVVFAVRDTGIGIPHEHRARLFEAFAQGDGSTTRRFGGTGLGLAISQRFSVMMGGTIEVDSTPGAGSTFLVRLPVEPPTPAAAE